MIRTKTEGGNVTFRDNSYALSKDQQEAVQAAMAAGLTDFITPTDPDDQGRIVWAVRTWVVSRDGKTAAFLVAYQTDNAHFEVLGPEIDLTPGLRKFAAAPPAPPTGKPKRGGN